MYVCVCVCGDSHCNYLLSLSPMKGIRWCYREGIMKEVTFELGCKGKGIFLKNNWENRQKKVFLQCIARHQVQGE